MGRGAMGEIFSVRDPRLRRRIAMKIAHADPNGRDSAGRFTRFVEEAQITGQLEHPNIVPVHELGVGSDGRPYFTMKLVGGRSLAEVLMTGDRPIGDLLRVFLKVCDAVAFAHSRGVIHRDLKPANVMVGDFGEVLVMDWGIAKIVGRQDPTSATVVASDRGDSADKKTAEGEMAGTPAYMSPEQARGDVAAQSTSTDVHALGALLYEIVTGSAPLEGGDIDEVLARARSGTVRWPRERFPALAVPRELDAVIRKAMAHAVRDRYHDVRALAADVEAWLEGRTLEAAVYHPLEPLWKLIKRNRAVSTVGALAMATMLGMVIVFVFNLDAARRDAEGSLALAQFAEARTLAGSGRLADASDRLDEMEAGSARHAVTPLGLAASRSQLADAGLGTELMVLRTGSPSVVTAAITPDGRGAVAIGSDGRLSRWDLPTGLPAATSGDHASDAAVGRAAFSNDRSLVVVSYLDRTLGLFEVTSGRQLWRVPNPAGSSRFLSFSSDDARIVTTGSDHLRIWDVAGPATIGVLPLHLGSQRQVTAASLSSDQQRVLVAGGGVHDSALELIDLATGSVVATWGAHHDEITVVKLLDAGRRAVTGCEDKTLVLWELAGQRAERTFVGHRTGVKCAAVSRDERILVSGSFDETIRAWDLEGGELLRAYSGHEASVTSVDLSPDRRHVLSAARDGTLRLWPGPGAEDLRIRVGPPGDTRVVLSRDGLRALTGTADGLMNLWDLSTGKCLASVRTGRRAVVALALSHDGRRALSANDGEVVQWDLVHLAPLGRISWPGVGVGFTAEGQAWIVDSASRQADANMSTGALRIAAHGALEGAPDPTAGGGTSLLAVTASGARPLRGAARLAAALDPAARHRSTHADVAADGRTMLMGSSETGAIIVLDLSTGERRSTFAGTALSVTAVAVSPDGTHGLIGSAEKTITLLDLVGRRELVAWPRQPADVSALAFRSDGRAFVAAGRDGTLALFDLTRPARREALLARANAARARLALDGRDGEALAVLAEALAFAGENAWAIELFERARGLGARVAPELLARTRWRLGHARPAADDFARALAEASPGDASWRLHLALCRNAARREAAAAR